MIEVLKVLNDHMVQKLKLNYEFGQYTETPPKYPYWVGDYTEPEPLEEDGLTTPTVTLTGFARGSFLGLEESKQKIKDYFKDGVSVITESGSAVVIYYAGSLNIPSDEQDLKRSQIKLSIKKWSV